MWAIGSAVPLTAYGVKLDDEALRVPVGLWFQLNICGESHEYQCRALVMASGSHGFSCFLGHGSADRHETSNDLICQGLAGFSQFFPWLLSVFSEPNSCHFSVFAVMHTILFLMWPFSSWLLFSLWFSSAKFFKLFSSDWFLYNPLTRFCLTELHLGCNMTEFFLPMILTWQLFIAGFHLRRWYLVLIWSMLCNYSRDPLGSHLLQHFFILFI